MRENPIGDRQQYAGAAGEDDKSHRGAPVRICAEAVRQTDVPTPAQPLQISVWMLSHSD